MQTIKNITLIDKKNCTGCYTCFNQCSMQAISMYADDEGFFYPAVDREKCINCGICLNSCPVKSKPNVNKKKDVYAAYAKNSEEHLTSSSGGIFAVLARYVLQNGGYICGAAFDETMTLKHILINSEEDLYKIKGTKYVQSEINDIYSQIKSLLEKGTMVLFGGTPCQVAGLKNYLNKEYDRLLTVDLICHGVPSPMVFKKYLEEISEEDEIKEISFRDKTNGLSDLCLSYILSNGETIREKYSESEYIKGFIQNLTIRSSCFRCKFKGLDRCSDFTIGDYWGLNDYHPEMITEMGTSAVFVHSTQGKKFFKLIKNNLIYTKSKSEFVSFWNPCLEKSVEYNPSREEFFKNIEKKTIKESVKQLCKVSEKKPVKNTFLDKVAKKAKNIIRNGYRKINRKQSIN